MSNKILDMKVYDIIYHLQREFNEAAFLVCNND